jgi:hypothetical protein
MKPFAVLLFISNLAFAQYWGGQKINESNISPWVPKFEIEYEGTHDFGEGESESFLNLFFCGDDLIGQVRSTYLEENIGVRKFNFKNLKTIKIDKTGKFTSDQHTGQFVIFTAENGKSYKSLKIDNPWSSSVDDRKFEIGRREKMTFENSYPGKYKTASFKKLEVSEIEKISTKKLMLMKNEIYARYGYVFMKDAKMDRYFKKQAWYQAQHESVDEFLTKIEVYNLRLIEEVK